MTAVRGIGVIPHENQRKSTVSATTNAAANSKLAPKVGCWLSRNIGHAINRNTNAT
jgi:hypothetical protein